MSSDEKVVVVTGFNQDGRVGTVSKCVSCDREVIASSSNMRKADVVLCPVCGRAAMAYNDKGLAM